MLLTVKKAMQTQLKPRITRNKHMSKFITVTNVASAIDKNGTPFQKVAFAADNYMKTVDQSTGEEISVKLRPLSATLNVYADATKGPNTDLQGVAAGDKFAGSIENREVTPYVVVNERQGPISISTYKAVVLGDTTDAGFEKLVEQAFARSKRELLTAIKPVNTLPRVEITDPKPVKAEAVPEAAEELWA